jgi:DNA polymerase (family 10)
MKHQGRKLLGDVLPIAEIIKEKLTKLKNVEQVWLAGSVRRRRETIGDLDFLVISKKPEPIIDSFTKFSEVEEILVKGSTKATVRINIGMDADLRVIPSESFGAALLYFSGSKGLNIELRKIAKGMNLRLNEYGLYNNGEMIAGKTEEEIFKALGLSYIEPEMRENRGEIQLAKENKLPKIIQHEDIKGDMQMHTKWSDGANTIKQMALAAIDLGYEYIAITDHTGSLRVAGGMNDEELQKQMKEIDKLNEEISDIQILKGVEVNIDSQGKLDMKNEILRDLDLVIASIHTGFRQDINKLTNRMISAMDNEHVDIIAHPTGRLIGEREGYEIDLEKIFQRSIETNTYLEINSFPNRLDLNDVMIKSAIEHGCQLVINTDSHNTKHLKYIDYGIATARRGWAQKKDILNTLSYKELIKKIS